MKNDSIEFTMGSVIAYPKTYLWTPKSDITAYELALCLPVLLGKWNSPEKMLELLPESARRHFVESKQKLG